MKRNILYILFLIASPVLTAQVTFKATVSKNELGLNERLRIEFSIDKQGGDDFTPPDFKNFKVLAGPSQATRHAYINGKESFSLTYTYIIQPIRKGTFIIPSAKIKYKGRILSSNTVKVRVTDAVAIPKDPNDPRYLAAQNIHLVAEISNTNPYVGESISVVYKLYVNIRKVNVQNTREVSSPSFSGFWNQNIKVDRWVAQTGMFNGEEHRFVVVKRSVLIPHKSGKLEIEPLEMSITAGVPMGQRDFFGNMMFKDVDLTVTSGKKTIRVKPLPEEGKPIDFNGAVGQFNFKVTTTKNTLKPNESATLQVEVSGKGNLKLIELPKIIAPKGLEIYDPEHKEQISIRLGGMKGKIYDRYAVVPQFKGKFKIPELSFSYFDPGDEQYHTVTSDPIIIHVPEGAPLASTDEQSVVKQQVITGENDIRYIKTKTKLVPATEKSDFYGSKLFYLLLLLPLLSIPAGIYIGKKKRERDNDIIGNKRRKADRLARKYLSKAKKQLGNKEPFYEALEKAIHNYLKAKLQVETTDISMERIEEILRSKKVDDETLKNFRKVMEDYNLARYAPSTTNKMHDDFERAKQVITRLDKYLS